MTPAEAIHNFQVIAEKYSGPLSHHQAIGQSISVLRAFIDEHTPKPVEVAPSETEMVAEAFVDVSKRPTKKPKKRK